MKRWMLVVVPLKDSLISFRFNKNLIKYFCFLALFSVFYLTLNTKVGAENYKSIQTNQKIKQLDLHLNDASSVCVIDLESNKDIFIHKAEQLLAPASTLKLVTSVASLYYLGSSFTFKTGAYLLPSKTDSKIIGIKGGGDPEFTTEQAFLFARKIKLSGIKNIKNLVLDTSALTDADMPQGDRAYEAGSSALSFNFNSTGIQICPGSDAENSLAIVGPLIWEDPIKIVSDVKTIRGNEVDLNLSRIDSNKIKVSGTIGAESNCVERYLSNKSPITSLGFFLKQVLEEMGLGTDITVSYAVIPGSAQELFEFESKPLSTLLIGLNHFSTNVSAQQILSAIGMKSDGSLSNANGIEKLTQFLAKLGFRDSVVEDGSGLSRNNRISTKAITAVLSYAWKEPEIRAFLEASLSILGESGTLKHRSGPKGDYQVFAKSGTLDGVSALAGYLHLKSGRTYAFSIIQNSVVDLDKAHKLEEMILKRLAEDS